MRHPTHVPRCMADNYLICFSGTFSNPSNYAQQSRVRFKDAVRTSWPPNQPHRLTALRCFRYVPSSIIDFNARYEIFKPPLSGYGCLAKSARVWNIINHDRRYSESGPVNH